MLWFYKCIFACRLVYYSPRSSLWHQLNTATVATEAVVTVEEGDTADMEATVAVDTDLTADMADTVDTGPTAATAVTTAKFFHNDRKCK